MHCPKCGHTEVVGERCVKCGAVVSKGRKAYSYMSSVDLYYCKNKSILAAFSAANRESITFMAITAVIAILAVAYFLSR